MVLGAVLGGLVVLWLVATAVSGDLQAGGFVLGLMLAAVLGLPPIGVGWYVLQRSKQEEVEEREFVDRRRVLEQDRLFRARIASEAGQQAARLRRLGGDPMLERAAARLAEVADQLEGATYEQAAWYEAVKLTDADLDALAAYDRVVSDGLRLIGVRVDRLELGHDEVGTALLHDVHSWEFELDARLELLRGERAPSRPLFQMLEAIEPARTADAIRALRLGDAVTFEETDYVVAVTVTYLVHGQTWKLHRLDAEEARHWLHVLPGVLTVALMDEVAIDAGLPEPFRSALHLMASDGLASATVESAAGTEQASVEYSYMKVGGAQYWSERWPDGHQRAYSGNTIRPGSLEVWPAERAPSGG